MSGPSAVGSRRSAVGWLATLALLLAGCGQVDDTYGRRSGAGGTSYAGTAVFGELVRSAGHRVSSWSRISPKLEDYDVIVWFPDDLSPPQLHQRAALQDWLANGSERILIYVGRDFNDRDAYLQAAQRAAPAEQVWELERRRAEARSQFGVRRTEQPDNEYARWFTIERNLAPRRVTSFESDYAWEADGSQVDITLVSRLRPPTPADLAFIPTTPPMPAGMPNFSSEVNDARLMAEDRNLPDCDVLLTASGEPLIWSAWHADWGDSQVIVVANSAFLLNLSLVNHEHRRLADQLIAQLPAQANVVFLESGPGGPPVHDFEGSQGSPTGLGLFLTWPLGLVLTHVVALGIIACFMMFPIFGRPQGEQAGGASDFGRHVAAVGELLTRANSQQYVLERLRHYHQHVRSESGASHSDRAVRGQSPSPPN